MAAINLQLALFHFITGKKSDDNLSQDYVPSVFNYVDSPVKKKSVTWMPTLEGSIPEKLDWKQLLSEAAASLLLLNNDVPEPEPEPEFELDPELEPEP